MENDSFSKLNKIVGGRLRQFREEKGLSLGDLASQAETTEEYLKSVENGEVVPDFKVLFKVNELLGIKFADLFRSEE